MGKKPMLLGHSENAAAPVSVPLRSLCNIEKISSVELMEELK